MGRNLLVKAGGSEYVLGESTFDAEEDLHSAFERHPELLPAEDMNLGQLLVVGREVAFESGSADLILIDEGGEIVIAEFKKGVENPDSRRVVAQMLDYGAALWKQSPEEFASKIALPYLHRHLSGLAKLATLEDAARERLGLEEEGIQQFSSNLFANLSSGTFNYVVVARTLPPTLDSVLRYLGAVSCLKIYAVAVDYFRDGEKREIMAPRVVLSSAAATHPPAVVRKATPETFLKDVGPAVEFWDRLLQLLDGLAGKMYWGAKGFSYRVVIDGKQYPILWGWPRTIWWLKDKGVGDELELALTPRPEQPDRLRTLLAEHLILVQSCSGAKPRKEGPMETLVFNVQTGLPHAEAEIFEALTALFESASKGQA